MENYFTLPHVSTLLCHSQELCSYNLAKLQKVCQMQSLVTQFKIQYMFIIIKILKLSDL